MSRIKEWSRSIVVRPKDHIVSHVKLDAPKFTPSFEKNCLRTDMNWLLGWEYGRVWLAERSTDAKKRAQTEKAKVIKNNYEVWLAKRRSIRKAAFV